MLSRLEIVPLAIVAGLDTLTVVEVESTIPPSPEYVVIVNPVFVAVEIGFLNPEHENLITVPAAMSLLGKAFETTRVSVEEVNVHEMVLSRFCRAEQI